ncbi:type I secretion system permease/ATPase [Marinobacterium sp. 3-1745]|uniref:Type I secretion system permease/ATPase n=2 Tax=Marinobacterium marinum TaxID=2756129 RepID=A0A7W1WYX2_9GAMM|nr:type I secretion system permease/ATPase [Marinobacterium marinum]
MHDDSLCQCLQWLAQASGNRRTRAALTEGLPLRGGQLTPSLLPRAAERAGMRARLVRQPLARLNGRWLPCILLLQGNRACVLEYLDSSTGEARVRVPELGMEVQTLTWDELQDDYAGVVAYCRPLLQLGEVAAEEAASSDSGHWFWSVIRGNRRIYRDVLLASLCVNLFALALPLFVMNVYDRVVPNQTTSTLWVLAAGVGIVIVADLVLRMLRGWFIELAAGRADNRLSARLMERVLGMRLEHMPTSIGALAGSIQGFESVRAFCGSMVVTALIDLPFFLLFLLIILIIAPLMAVPVVVGALLLLLYALSVQQQMRRLADVSGQASAQRTAGVIESLSCLPLLKSLNATGRMQRQWEQATRFLSGTGSRQRLLGTSVSMGAAWVQQTVAVSMIIIGVYLVIDGQMSQGALIAAYMLSSRAMAPVSQTAALLTQYHQAASALNMLDEVMETPQERSPGQQSISHEGLRGEIEFSNVSFTYPGEERAALNGISLRIKAGEKIGIIGAAGSGKSTLEKLILGLYRPTQGSVLLDGLNQTQLDPAEVRRSIGYLPQDLQLINGSVYDNVTLGMDDVEPHQLQQAVRVSGLDTLIGPEADGWSRQVGEQGLSLSGGQRQTLALARAVLMDAPVLLLDEPASAMDSMMEQHICRQLKEHCQDKTLLLITHRTSLLQLVDRLVVMDKGKILADGPKQTVLDALAQGRVKRAAA